MKKPVTKTERELIRLIEDFISYLDKTMKMPSTVQRGKRIAEIINAVELKNDLIKQRLGMRLKKSTK